VLAGPLGGMPRRRLGVRGGILAASVAILGPELMNTATGATDDSRSQVFVAGLTALMIVFGALLGGAVP
jgi:hypothetical protein